jgi:hypothetical protein
MTTKLFQRKGFETVSPYVVHNSFHTNKMSAAPPFPRKPLAYPHGACPTYGETYCIRNTSKSEVKQF